MTWVALLQFLPMLWFLFALACLALAAASIHFYGPAWRQQHLSNAPTTRRSRLMLLQITQKSLSLLMRESRYSKDTSTASFSVVIPFGHRKNNGNAKLTKSRTAEKPPSKGGSTALKETPFVGKGGAV